MPDRSLPTLTVMTALLPVAGGTTFGWTTAGSTAFGWAAAAVNPVLARVAVEVLELGVAVDRAAAVVDSLDTADVDGTAAVVSVELTESVVVVDTAGDD